MAKVYVPEFNTGNCVYIVNSDVIRVYDSIPTHNSIINYKDYYIKSSYIYNEGVTTFSQYSTLPTCINNSRITTNYTYRNDFPFICLTAFIIGFVCYFFIKKVVRGVFLGWRWS